jgi:hypothetical protein
MKGMEETEFNKATKEEIKMGERLWGRKCVN